MRSLRLLVFLFWVVLPAFSERYALLVGVSKYQAGEGRFNLDGPAFDVSALKASLVAHGNFLESNIHLLVNEQATRAAVLEAIQAVVSSAKAGDYVLFYFSGHGTSSFDKNVPALAPGLGPNTGALVPYDARFSSPQALLDTIIVGRRDLRIPLSKLDPNAQALIILDACYSGESTKGIPLNLGGRPKYIPFSAAAGNTDSLRGLPSLSDAETSLLAVPASVEPYPYRNIVSLTAASKFEPALDISADQIQSGHEHTIDGHPHGAFTNSLLRGLNGEADKDHDGMLTYAELYQFVREDVENQFPHKPQMQLPAEDYGRNLVFGDHPRPVPDSTPAPQNPKNQKEEEIRIQLQGVDKTIQSQIAALPCFHLVDTRPDLILSCELNGSLVLYHGSRRYMRSYDRAKISELLNDLRRQPLAFDLLNWRFSRQSFDISMDVTHNGQGEFWDNQQLRFHVTSQKPAQLLLLDIDSTGGISVLYPTASAKPDDAARGVSLGAGTVGPPYGVEYLKLFAFAEAPEGFEYFRCSEGVAGKTKCLEFMAGDADYNRLLKMLQSASPASAETRFQVVTKP